MNDHEIAQLTLLVTAANLQVNLDILEVSHKILQSNIEHTIVFEKLIEEIKNVRNIQ